MKSMAGKNLNEQHKYELGGAVEVTLMCNHGILAPASWDRTLTTLGLS